MRVRERKKMLAREGEVKGWEKKKDVVVGQGEEEDEGGRGKAGVSTIKAAQEKRRPGAGCGNVPSMVPETRALWWWCCWCGGCRVVISQAWRRARALEGPRG